MAESRIYPCGISKEQVKVIKKCILICRFRETDSYFSDDPYRQDSDLTEADLERKEKKNLFSI